jgi:hypothetical protein
MVISPNPTGSPNIPPRPSGDDHPDLQRIGKDKTPWPVLMLFVLAVLIIAIITVLPRGRKTTKVPVQLSQIEIVPAPAVGGRTSAVYLDAFLHNTGTTAITEVDVTATFVRNNGTLETINGLLAENIPDTRHSHDLVNDPIKPNESRRVSIYVEEPPTEWNHQPPQITVENVSATTPP